MGELVRIVAVETGSKAAWASFLIHTCALQLGIIPSSIHDLYITRGKGEIPETFTTPAINLRTLSFESARAAFRSARKINSSLMIFEIARVELLWGGISLAEYTACILGAAIAEGYAGPVFLQGDHFQISPSLPLQDEIDAIKTLIQQAIRAGFYNIDIDSSTLVDLSKKTTNDQQSSNALVSAELAACIRELQPQGITISIGGEIGEVGGHVSTIDELHAYLTQFNTVFSSACPGQPGLSKVSIHTGTTHGGIALADGSIARPSIDFDSIQRISKIGRQNYGLGGVVQHGASTLPLEDFGLLVKFGTLEVHLATAFMSTVFTHLPVALNKEVRTWLDENYSHERTDQMTDAQFYHKVEMHALAPFKKALWNLPSGDKEVISNAWEAQFDAIFHHLGCANSRPMVEKYVKPVIINPVFDPALHSVGSLQPSKGLSG